MNGREEQQQRDGESDADQDKKDLETCYPAKMGNPVKSTGTVNNYTTCITRIIQ